MIYFLTVWRRPKTRRRLLGLLIVLLLAGLGWHISRLMRSPVYGTVSHSGNAGVRQEQLTDSTSYTTLNSQYYSLLYPGGYTSDLAGSRPANSLSYYYF